MTTDRTLGIAIQFHPRRADLVTHRLLPRLRDAHHAADIALVGDPEPLSPLKSAWRTYRDCVTVLRKRGHDHSLIVQDDALPCPEFIPALRNALEAQPDAIIVLCVCGSSPVNCQRLCEAWDAGLSWVELDTWTWVQTVAVCYPRAAIEALYQWIETKARLPATQRTDDPVIARFVQAHDFRLLGTVPNLVDHPDDSPSLMPDTPFWAGVAPERVSCCMIANDRSALDIDWTKGP